MRTEIANGVNFTNSATLTPQGGGVGASPTTPLGLTSVVLPNLSTSTKTSSPADGSVVPEGGLVVYTITINNTRNVAALVNLTDSVSTALTAVSVTGLPAGATDNSVGNAINIQGITVPALGSETVEITGTVASGLTDGTVITNSATITPQGGGIGGSPSTALGLTVDVPPDLSTSTKTSSPADGSVVNPGDSVVYTITINNTNDVAAVADLTDAVPAALESVSVTALPGGSTDNSSGNAIDVQNISVAALGSAVVEISGTVASGLTDGTVITNSATITPQGGGIGGSPSTPLGLTVDVPPDLSTSTKTSSPTDGSSVGEGDSVVYTVTIINTEDSTGLADLTDTVPSEMENVSVTGLPAGAVDNSTGNSINVTGIPIPALGSVTVEISGTVRSGLANGTVFTNTASVTPQGAGVGASPSTPIGLTVAVTPNLSTSTLTSLPTDGGTVSPGGAVTYTVTINNANNVAAVVDLDDTVNSILTNVIVSSFPSGAVDNSSGNTIDVNNIPVPALGSAAVEITGTVRLDAADGVNFTNSATVTPQGGGTGANLSTPLGLTVEVLPNLSTSTKVSITPAEGGTVSGGDTVVYRITINNSRNVAGTVHLTDTVPSELENVSVTSMPAGSSNLSSGNSVNVNNIPIAALGSAIVEITGTVRDDVADGAHITNSASLSPNGGGVPGSPSTPQGLTAAILLDVSGSTKTSDPVPGTTVARASTVTYTIEIDNANNVAEDVTITDTLSPRLENALVVDAGGGTPSVVGNQITITGVPVNAFGSNTVRISGTVRLDAPSASAIANSAQITPEDGGAPVVVSSGALVVETTFAPATFTSSIIFSNPPSDGVSTVMRGETVFYTVRLQNTGELPGQVDLEIDVPDELESGVITATGGGTVTSFEGSDPMTVDNINVPAMSSVDVILRASVRNSVADGQFFIGSATIHPPVGASFVVNTPNTIRTLVGPDLRDSTLTGVNTTSGPDQILAGDTLEFTLEIVNANSFAAPNVEVEVPLPANTINIQLVSVSDLDTSWLDLSDATRILIQNIDVPTNGSGVATVVFTVEVATPFLSDNITGEAEVRVTPGLGAQPSYRFGVTTHATTYTHWR